MKHHCSAIITLAIIVILVPVNGDNLKCVQCGPSMKNFFSLGAAKLLGALQSLAGSKDDKIEEMKKELDKDSASKCTTDWPKETECSASDKFCVKWTAEDSKGQKQDIRFCSDTEMQDCDEKTKVCAYSCNTDGCNGAEHVSKDNVVVALAMSLVLLLAKY